MKKIKLTQQLHNSQLFRQYFKRILLFFSIPSLLFSTVLFSYYEYHNSAVEERAFSETVNHSTQLLNNLFDELQKKYYLLNYDKTIKRHMFLDSKSFFLSENQVTVSYLNSQLSYMLNTSNIIDSVYLYSKNNEYIYCADKTQLVSSNHLNSFTDKAWLQVCNDTSAVQLITGAYNDCYKSNVISVIYQMNSDNIATGYLVFNITESTLKNMLFSNAYTSAENILITSGDNKIYSAVEYDTDKPRLKSVLSHSTNLDFPNVTLTVTFKANNRNVFSVVLLAIFILTLGIIIPILLSFILANSFYRSISQIASYLLEIYPQETDQNNEMEFIQNNIKKIIQTSQNLEHSVAHYISESQQAQLTSLQSQLNPHFLFNTLNALSLMNSTDADKDEFELLVHNLSNILSYALDTENNIVPLADEIEYAMDYIAIEETKYRSKINIYLDIPENLMNVSVPKFILQPILENSFKHGFTYKFNDASNITVQVRDKKGALIVKVTDNGTGISDSNAKKINSLLSEGYFSRQKHIGLYNINKRIQLLYGKRFGLRIYPIEKNGMQVVITLPMNQSK